MRGGAAREPRAGPRPAERVGAGAAGGRVGVGDRDNGGGDDGAGVILGSAETGHYDCKRAFCAPLVARQPSPLALLAANGLYLSVQPCAGGAERGGAGGGCGPVSGAGRVGEWVVEGGG